jgi:hypothetical protein
MRVKTIVYEPISLVAKNRFQHNTKRFKLFFNHPLKISSIIYNSLFFAVEREREIYVQKVTAEGREVLR